MCTSEKHTHSQPLLHFAVLSVSAQHVSKATGSGVRVSFSFDSTLSLSTWSHEYHSNRWFPESSPLLHQNDKEHFHQNFHSKWDIKCYGVPRAVGLALLIWVLPAIPQTLSSCFVRRLRCRGPAGLAVSLSVFDIGVVMSLFCFCRVSWSVVDWPVHLSAVTASASVHLVYVRRSADVCDATIYCFLPSSCGPPYFSLPLFFPPFHKYVLHSH